MGHGPGKPDQLVRYEYRRKNKDILQMLPTPVRIVINIKVPFFQVFGRHDCRTGPENVRHRAKLHWNQLSLGHHVAGTIEKRCGGILCLADDVGIGRTDEFHAHLPPRRHQRLADHRVFDRVQLGAGHRFRFQQCSLGHRQILVMMVLSCESRTACQPVGRNKVEVGSSSKAGPATGSPTTRLARLVNRPLCQARSV